MIWHVGDPKVPEILYLSELDLLLPKSGGDFLAILLWIFHRMCCWCLVLGLVRPQTGHWPALGPLALKTVLNGGEKNPPSKNSPFRTALFQENNLVLMLFSIIILELASPGRRTALHPCSHFVPIRLFLNAWCGCLHAIGYLGRRL